MSSDAAITLRRRACLGGAASLAVPHWALAQSADAGWHEVELRVSDYPLLFVALTLDGQPALALVDSGSSAALRVSARMAERLGLALQPVPGATVRGLDGRAIELRRGTLGRLSLGSFEQREVVAEVAGERIEGIAAQVGTAFDAQIGWGFLRRFAIELDLAARRLRLGSGSATPAWPARLDWIDYQEARGLPVVEGRFGARPVRLLVDTGAPMCNIDAARVPYRVGSIVRRELALGALQLPVDWRVKDLAVQRRTLEAEATLGLNLLLDRVLRVDPRARRLSVTN